MESYPFEKMQVKLQKLKEDKDRLDNELFRQKQRHMNLYFQNCRLKENVDE